MSKTEALSRHLKTSLVVRVPVDLKEALTEMSRQERNPLSSLVRRILASGLIESNH